MRKLIYRFGDVRAYYLCDDGTHYYIQHLYKTGSKQGGRNDVCINEMYYGKVSKTLPKGEIVQSLAAEYRRLVPYDYSYYQRAVEQWETERVVIERYRGDLDLHEQDKPQEPDVLGPLIKMFERLIG